MIALKRQVELVAQQMSTLTLEQQKKNQFQHQVESSYNAQQNLEQALVNIGEVQTRSMRLDFPVFNRDDPEGWLYKVK